MISFRDQTERVCPRFFFPLEGLGGIDLSPTGVFTIFPVGAGDFLPSGVTLRTDGFVFGGGEYARQAAQSDAEGEGLYFHKS